MKEVVNMNMKLWKVSKSQSLKLLRFGKHGRTLFKTITELVIEYHKKRKFSSQLLGKLRFFPISRWSIRSILLRTWLDVNFFVTRRQICYIWGIILWVFNYFADFFLYIQYLFSYHIFFVWLLFFFFFFDNAQTYNNTPTPKLLAVVRVAELYGLGKFHILANGHLITYLLLYCTPHYISLILFIEV